MASRKSSGTEFNATREIEMDSIDYFMDKADREAMREETLELATEELMKDGAEYSPLNPSNLCETFGEMPDEMYGAIASFIRADDGPKLLAMIASFNDAYWNKLARSEAERDLQRQINEHFNEYNGE